MRKLPVAFRADLEALIEEHARNLVPDLCTCGLCKWFFGDVEANARRIAEMDILLVDLMGFLPELMSGRAAAKRPPASQAGPSAAQLGTIMLAVCILMFYLHSGYLSPAAREFVGKLVDAIEFAAAVGYFYDKMSRRASNSDDSRDDRRVR
jgi:hypothetical protein